MREHFYQLATCGLATKGRPRMNVSSTTNSLVRVVTYFCFTPCFTIISVGSTFTLFSSRKSDTRNSSHRPILTAQTSAPTKARVVAVDRHHPPDDVLHPELKHAPIPWKERMLNSTVKPKRYSTQNNVSNHTQQLKHTSTPLKESMLNFTVKHKWDSTQNSVSDHTQRLSFSYWHRNNNVHRMLLSRDALQLRQNEVNEVKRSHRFSPLRKTARTLNRRQRGKLRTTQPTTKPKKVTQAPWKEETASSGDNYNVELDPQNTTHFPIEAKECKRGRTIPIRGDSGVVYLVNNSPLPRAVRECYFDFTVNKGYFFAARFQMVPPNIRSSIVILEIPRKGAEECLASCKIVFDRDEEINSWNRDEEINSWNRDEVFYSSDNTALFQINTGLHKKQSNLTMFYIFFTSLAQSGRHVLQVVTTSQTTGQVFSLGFGKVRYSSCTKAKYHLIVPPHHVLMVSFPCANFVLNDIVTLLAETVDTVTEQSAPKLYTTSVLVLFNGENGGGAGFKMDFSFHRTSDVPVMYENGSWDCSKPNYNTFKHHLQCDFETDCVGGEDEGGHCPYSSQLCNGGVALDKKCYKVFLNKKRLTWLQADQACKVQGGFLASLRTSEEWEAVNEIFHYSKRLSSAFVGLRQVYQPPLNMYWKMWEWSDGVVAYNFDVSIELISPYRIPYRIACTYQALYSPYMTAIPCNKKHIKRYICGFDVEAGNSERPAKKVEFLNLVHRVSHMWAGYQVTQCPSGHVTFSFLSCEPASDCGHKRHQTSCTTLYQVDPDVTDSGMVLIESKKHASSNLGLASTDGPLSGQDTSNKYTAVTVSMFACTDSQITLPFSLVCDYVKHCPNGFDESMCKYQGTCHAFECKNGQCVSIMSDFMHKCLDKSDGEHWDAKTYFDFFSGRRIADLIKKPPSSVIEFDGKGYFKQSLISESEPCPETHFRCLGIGAHCLPVFVRCNGVYDCPDHEDEEECDRYTCPGFYRCRESRVCLHVDYMCDDWPQCPESDDELYCGLTCPPGCLCQGLAVVCSIEFPAHKYNTARYIDAGGSKMKPPDFLRNNYLVWLSLASCDIDHVSNLTWPNMFYLDLSTNNIDVVNMTTFLNLPNLITLILAHNPLVSFIEETSCLTESPLNHLDLSKTLLQEFDSKVLSCFNTINKLNISYCPIKKITSFNSTIYLTDIDVRGSPVTIFPRTLFKDLAYLKYLTATNYKMCCKTLLPDNFNENFCFSPQDEISSCDDLLRSNILRGCLWIFAGLALMGNGFCFFLRFSSNNKISKSGFNVFVTNLTVADFFMGVYLVIVGVADMVYRGQYVWSDISWKTSSVCAVAGFLSLLSSEMSAFMIFVITLDRFIVLTFPFSDIRFKGRSAVVTCGLLWTVGVLLSSVPLFPMTPRWEFFGQTGICIPLPVTRGNFHGQDYAFGVMIIFNFFLFVLITGGQMCIYRSIRANSMVSDNSRKSKDLVIARRLITVAASDFFCWFPIGLFGIMSSNGVSVSSTVSVAMAILVLPLNSAMNPFLYTFNVVMEKRRKVREAQLMKILETKILLQKN